MMGVRRFRSVEDVPEPPPPADALAALRSACELGSASRWFGHEVVAPRGVVKYRSVAEADAARAAREARR